MDANPPNLIDQVLDALEHPFCIVRNDEQFDKRSIETDRLTLEEAREIMSGPMFFFQHLDDPRCSYYIARRDNIEIQYE